MFSDDKNREGAIDCQTRRSIPLCGPIRTVVNLSSVPIRVEGWYDQIHSWTPLVPRVEPTAEYSPYAGALWIPRNVILRSVNIANDEPLTVFGAVGDGISLIQSPDVPVSSVNCPPVAS